MLHLRPFASTGPCTYYLGRQEQEKEYHLVLNGKPNTEEQSIILILFRKIFKYCYA